MTHCFHGNNPAACRYHPRCARDIVTVNKVEAGNSLGIGLEGPCVLYIRTGKCWLECNGFLSLETAPQFLLVPHFQLKVKASTDSEIYIFHPELTRILADKLAVDYLRTRNGDRHNLHPVSLSDPGKSAALSRGILPGYLQCRHYAESKFREIIHTIDPANHPLLKRTLTSKEWFFRVKVRDLAFSCKTMEELARAVGQSKSGFSKKFRRLFGTSFYQWYMDRKFEAIVDDILTSDLTVSELTRKYRFYSVQHFGHFIKKRTGLSAGEFRERLRAARDPADGHQIKRPG